MPSRTKKPAIPEGVSLTKQRAYVSDVSVSLGLLTVPCDMVPAKATDNSVKFKVICPHADHGNDAVPPQQRYLCEGHTAEDAVRAVLAAKPKASELAAKIEAALLSVHGPYSAADAARAREVDRVLHRVTAEEIEALKTGDETDITEGSMALASSPRAQVQASVLPNGTVYRLRPRPGAYMAYAVLMDALEDTGDDFVTYGEVIARDTQKLFVLSVFTDAEGTRQIIAQETLRPGDMAPLDKVVVDYPESHRKMAVDLIRSAAVDFEADSYINQRKVRAEALDEQLRTAGGGTATSTTAGRSADPSNAANDLFASLSASLDAAKAKKAS